MSIRFAVSIACGLCMILSPAHAFDVTGGEISLGHSIFTDNGDLARSSLEGSVELGFSQSIGVQIDAGSRSFKLANESSSMIAVHGIYHISQATSAGVFVGTESFASDNNMFYGVEMGSEFSKGDFEGYLGTGEDSGTSATVLGVSGSYELNDKVSMDASLDYLRFDGDNNLTRLGVTGNYAVGQQTSLYGELGTLSASGAGASGSETFIGLGAEFNFGAERGATFGRRGLLDLIPGL